MSDEGAFSIDLVLEGSRPDLEFELLSREIDEQGEAKRRAIGACRGRCSLEVPEGRYELRVGAAPDSGLVRDSTLEFKVVSPSTMPVSHFRRSVSVRGRLWTDATLTVAPISRARTDAGLNLGIAGATLVGTGSLLVLTALWSALPAAGCYSEECDRGRPLAYAAGLSMLVIGVVITPLGWVMHRTSPGVRVRESGTGRPWRRL